MERKFRPILPTPSRSIASAARNDNAQSIPRRKTTIVACNTCRQKKRRTSIGLRLPRPPGHEEKLLVHLRQRTTILEQLKSLPEEEALELLRRLRSTSEPSRALAAAEGSMQSRQRPSDLQLTRATCHPTSSSFEFEIMVGNILAYARINPQNTDSVEQFLQQSALLAGSMTDEALSTSRYRTRAAAQALFSSASPLEYKASSLSSSAQSYADGPPGQSTMVLGYFDADVMLEDLVACRPRFCSAFLVSSLLFFACQSHSAVDAAAAPLSLAFSEEAEMLWRGETASDSVTTISAIMLLYSASVCQGKNALCLELMDASFGMAERLGLFGVPPDSAIATSHRQRSSEWVKAASHAAWGAYNLLTLLGAFYISQGIRHPPTLPEPGATGSEEYGAAALWPRRAASRHTAPTFPISCRLFVIAQEVVAVYSACKGDSIPERVALAFVEEKYQKLLACMGRLEKHVAQGENAPLHVLVFYVHFHCLVLNIFRPFVEVTQGNLQSFSSVDSSPKAVLTASVNQLKQTLFWIFSSYKQSLTQYVTIGLLSLCDILLQDEDDSSRRIYCRLCIRGCEYMYISYPVLAEVAKAFLSKAIQYHVVSSAEALSLMTDLEQRGQHHARSEEVIAGFFSDLKLATEDPDDATVQAAARRFDELILFDEFTTLN